jgi:hypothetical protein
VFNGRVTTIDRATGKQARPHLISVQAERSAFDDLVLAEVDPAACLKYLNALVSANPFDLEAVEPFIAFDLKRFRFVDGAEELAELDSRRNLLKLSPTEFEQQEPVLRRRVPDSGQAVDRPGGPGRCTRAHRCDDRPQRHYRRARHHLLVQPYQRAVRPTQSDHPHQRCGTETPDQAAPGLRRDPWHEPAEATRRVGQHSDRQTWAGCQLDPAGYRERTNQSAIEIEHAGPVNAIGEQFRRELRLDFAPFDMDDPESVGVLIDSKRFLATFPIAAGAAGLERASDRWILKWVWLHPYERGTGCSPGPGTSWSSATAASILTARTHPPWRRSSGGVGSSPIATTPWIDGWQDSGSPW